MEKFLGMKTTIFLLQLMKAQTKGILKFVKKLSKRPKKCKDFNWKFKRKMNFILFLFQTTPISNITYFIIPFVLTKVLSAL